MGSSVRSIDYRIILKPSVNYLERCHALMLDSTGMASFLSGILARQRRSYASRCPAE
jgi:hypothetical protein